MALFYVSNWDSFIFENYKLYLSSKCPVIINNKYRFKVIRDLWYLDDLWYSSLDHCRNYKFTKNDIIQIKIYLDKYKAVLDNIIKEFSVKVYY